jgi:hypothetical protein
MKNALSILGAMSGALLLRVALIGPTLHQEQGWPVRTLRQGVDHTSDPQCHFHPGWEPVTISADDGRLHDILRQVSEQAQAQLWLSPGINNPHLAYSAAGAPVRDVLSELCERERCRWKMVTSIVVWDSNEPTPEWSLTAPGTESGR